MTTPMPYLPWQQPLEWAGRPCVADAHRDLSYAEFAAWVDAAARDFAARGIGRGDVIAVQLPNRVELLVAIVAAWRVGAAATPVNPVFTASEADHQIRDSGASLVITDPAEVPTAPGETELPPVRNEPGDTALLIYASGSTGRPKGVILTHANLSAMAQAMVGHLEVSEDDHALLVLPLFHVNAIMVSFVTPISVGGRLTVLERFVPDAFLDAVEAVRPTYFSAVPTIYAHLVAAGERRSADMSSLRLAVCGAAPASEELLTAAEALLGCPLLEGYGLTEGTCASTVNPLHGSRRLGTVGVALPGQQVAIMAPDGALLPPGERGEVVIAGPTVMEGYLNRPEATAEALVDGWLHTGDVGILDADGYLRLVDRIKDMIIRGGENLYPKEIESVLHRHPAVMEAAVVGEPHELYGEVPIAFVATYPDAVVTAAELEALCRENLTKVKVPVRITLLESLPKNPVGKIDKPTLRVGA